MSLPKLTLGMAVYDDFHGAIFTIQTALLHDPEVVQEVVVIDNNPSSSHGKMLKDFCNARPGVIKYVEYTKLNGTANTRNQVFKHATNDYVVVCDPHVIFPKGSLRALSFYYSKYPDIKDLIQGPLLYDDGKGISTHFDLSKWGGEMWGQWGTDPQYKAGKPFEIPAQGLGAFSCRKDSWLWFNQRFKGFGGEEGYIHEKYRKAGHKALCLPEFLWWHRFGRPDGVPYPLAIFDKVRNYCIGFNELGLSLDPVYQHFVKEGRISEEQWEYFKKEDYPPDMSKSSCKPCQAAQEAKAKQPSQQEIKTPAEWYAWAKDNPSDINEHVSTLRELAEGCDTVVELVSRSGISTAALLAGRPKNMVTISTINSQLTKNIGEVYKDIVSYKFFVGETENVTIPKCELLFVDSKHTADHVWKELSKHAGNVSKRIVFHDTEIFGETGEDGSPGLMPAIRRFLAENLEWTVLRHDKNNHGLTVISRDPADRKPLPSTWKQGLNFLKAKTKHALNGGKFLSLPMAEERLAICSDCPERAGPNCSKCGCFLWQIPDDSKINAGQPGKVFYPKDSCPLGKWVAKPDDTHDYTKEELEVIFKKEE
jgi:hypothetical protein